MTSTGSKSDISRDFPAPLRLEEPRAGDEDGRQRLENSELAPASDVARGAQVAADDVAGGRTLALGPE
jgi:hypothetical protein